MSARDMGVAILSATDEKVRVPNSELTLYLKSGNDITVDAGIPLVVLPTQNYSILHICNEKDSEIMAVNLNTVEYFTLKIPKPADFIKKMREE